MARSTIFNKEIDLDLAQHIVHGVVHNETKAVTIDDILEVVCMPVLHACKTVKGQLEVDKSFQAEVQEIESLLKKKA